VLSGVTLASTLLLSLLRGSGNTVIRRRVRAPALLWRADLEVLQADGGGTQTLNPEKRRPDKKMSGRRPFTANTNAIQTPLAKKIASALEELWIGPSGSPETHHNGVCGSMVEQ
jgi:hypothetical protein